MLHPTHPPTLIMPVEHITLVVLVLTAIGWALTELLTDCPCKTECKMTIRKDVDLGMG
jgi:hypothetical protein